MAGIVKSRLRRKTVCCDFWFFAVIAVAVYLGGEALHLMLAAALHEAGHCIALFATKNRIAQVQLKGFGIKIVPQYRRVPTVWQETVILFAGPLAGLMGAMLLKPVAPVFSKMSLLLSVFNLLPIRGLDGGSMLRLLWEAAFNGRKSWLPDAVGAITVLFSLTAGIRTLLDGQPNIPLLGVALFLSLKQFVLAGDTD